MQEIGEDNIFIFGARASEVAGLRAARAEFQASCQNEELDGSAPWGTVSMVQSAFSLDSKTGLR